MSIPFVLAAVLVIIAVRGFIDVNTEHVLTLSQLARRLPCRRQDRPVHPATVHRWRCPGVHGLRLECVRIGGIWHTSLEAYQRWVERLTVAAAPVPPSTPTTTGEPLDATDRHAIVERRLQELDPIAATNEPRS